MNARSAHRPLLLLVALLTLPVLGCASGSGSGGGNPFQEGGAQEIRIAVRNLNFNDATVWALSTGGRHRLGTVSGKTDRTFTLDWSRAQQLRLRIRIQSGRECETRAITTDPGDTLQITIDVNFDRSRVCR